MHVPVIIVADSGSHSLLSLSAIGRLWKNTSWLEACVQKLTTVRFGGQESQHLAKYCWVIILNNGPVNTLQIKSDYFVLWANASLTCCTFGIPTDLEMSEQVLKGQPDSSPWPSADGVLNMWGYWKQTLIVRLSLAVFRTETTKSIAVNKYKVNI